MSSRNFRKVAGKPTLPPPVDSDEEYQPLYAQKSGNSKYADLMVSSESESEKKQEPEKSEDELQNNAAAVPSSSTNKKKNKKKGKGKGKKQADAELDEIDRSVQEVNAILGAPVPPMPPKPQISIGYTLLAVNAKHLNVSNELKRMFGPEEVDRSQRRNTRMHPNRALLLKRVLIHPNKDTAVYDFKNSGLTMSKFREENGRQYFIFNHDVNYQKMHSAFLFKFFTSPGSAIVMHLDEARQNMHVEALLEISDRLFRMEENGVANEIVENVCTYLQYVADPLFILTRTNVRLEYKYMENRPFHVAMLKYIYLLSNKACHRTALELAKMMLLIDPSDPVAMLLLLDVLALRAREHEWLISAIKYFDRQREAGMLYNLKYSNGLAHYHVAIKKKLPLDEADTVIKDAILAHPEVFVKILDCCNVSNPELLGHAIFKKEPRQVWTGGVEELFVFYAKMTWPRWNEPAVMSWLLRNATELCANYDRSRKVQNTAEDYARLRVELFQVWPPEYLRHMSIFRSMAKLIIDAPLTAFNRYTCAWDPLFEKSVNRYGYSYGVEPPRNVGVSVSPVYSYDMRNDDYIAISQMSMHWKYSHLSREEIARLIIVPSAYGFEPTGQHLGPDSDDDEEYKFQYENDQELFEEYEQEMADLLAGAVNLESDEDEDDTPEPAKQAQEPAPRE